jgi:hypothetical protein
MAANLVLDDPCGEWGYDRMVNRYIQCWGMYDTADLDTEKLESKGMVGKFFWTAILFSLADL